MIIFSILLLSVVVIAEVPEHNPSLDYKCSEGKQWSKGPITCKQTNCPPGSGRTYTYDCSCWVSEWGGEPKVTCYENGLAVKCLPKGGDCNAVKSGFDPVTGNCKTGYTWNSDHTSCAATFPDTITCKVVDLDGNTVKNQKVSYAEYTEGGHETSPDTGSAQSGTTDDNGQVQFSVKNKFANSVNFIFRGGDGYYKSNNRVYADNQKECVIKTYTNSQVESYIKKEYKNFLQNACLPQELINKVDEAQFNFDSDVDTSQYDGSKMQISKGELDGGDWETLQRTLFHEFSHYLSEKIIDPSKNVGGHHNNWAPNEDKSWWQFTKSDPEELAYEEGLADFMSMLYFQSKGEVYQSDYATDSTAKTFIVNNGKDKGSKTEGVVTSFLYSYYKPQLGEQNGAAHALGDFIKSGTYERRNRDGTAARTIKEFIVQKIKSDRETPNECSSKSQMPNIADLSHDFGFDSDQGYKLTVDLLTKDDTNDVILLNPTPDQLTPASLLQIGIPYELRTNTGEPVLEYFPGDYASTGTNQRITFKPGASSFELTQDNVVIIRNGTAYVVDASVKTPHIRINHRDTQYIVEVSDTKDTVTVINGSVDMSDSGGAVSSLNSGESISYSSGAFSPVTKVDTNNIPKFWKNTKNDGGNGNLPCCLPGLFIGVLLAALFIRRT